MPGPTGESNRLDLRARAPVLCLGPGDAARADQKAAVERLGGSAVVVSGHLPPDELARINGFSGVLWWGDATEARAYTKALAARAGQILPLITTEPDAGHVLIERHLCVDTTASGGNAALLADVGE